VPRSEGPSLSTGAIATPHALATEAATGAYRDGGCAIDAAIAAAAVLCVVYPHNVALGGDLIALVHLPDGQVMCVNASGWAGAGVDPAAMRLRHGSSLPARGADTVTVPGGIRGWETIHRMGGRLPWHRLLQPAIEAAQGGVPVAESLGAHLADPENADLIGTEDFDRVFRPGGVALGTGDEFRQPELAATLATLADGGADEFYSGALAGVIAQYLQSRGSALTAADFAEFQAEVGKPICAKFRDLTVLTSPPNTHGFLMLRALTALEQLGIGAPLEDGLGTLMRLFHHGNALRDSYLADPRTSPVDLAALMHGELASFSTQTRVPQAAKSIPHGDTVGIAAADSDGIAVSLIQSVYHAFGSGLIDPRTGILFHNRGTSFSLDSRSPNVLAPRKRPLHTLMPVMTTQDGRLRHVLATMGGQGQPQILTQVLLRMMDGTPAAAAVAAPRAVVGHQMLGCHDDSVVVEADVTADAMASVVASGLDVIDVPQHCEALGHANVVDVGPLGVLTAATDPRADGSAVVAQYGRYHLSA
jgi:gamma-glutamyltranspeptidase